MSLFAKAEFILEFSNRTPSKVAGGETPAAATLPDGEVVVADAPAGTQQLEGRSGQIDAIELLPA